MGGTATDTVTIYRNGELMGTFENTGRYRDREHRVSGTSFTYMVCDETTACSEEVTVTF